MTTAPPVPFAFDVTLTRSVIVRLIAYSLALFWVAFELFNAVTGHAMPRVNAVTITAAVLVFVATIVLHECVHGAGMRLFGARPEYGLALVRHILPVAYATAPGHRFTLRQMTIVALAPFVVLSAATLALAILVPSIVPFAFLAFAANFTGAVGDLWMTAVMWRFRGCRDVCVIDRKSGITIESTDPAARAVAAALHRAGGPTTRLAVGSMCALALIAWAGLPVAELFTSRDAERVLVGPSWFPLLEYTRSDNAVWVYPRHLVVGSVALALPCLLFPRRKRVSEVEAGQARPDSPGVPAWI